MSEAPQQERSKPLLHVHKIVEIDGGKFRVSSIGKKFLCLEALPSTDVVEHRIVAENAQLRTIAQENFVERQRLLGLVFAALNKFGTETMPDVKEFDLPYADATTLDPKVDLEVKPQPDNGVIAVRRVKKA